MRKMLLMFFASMLSINIIAATEVWELKLIMDVPRVVDNMQSFGYRKYQTQRIKGKFTLTYNEEQEPTIEFICLENLTHKVNGKNVTYNVSIDDVKWHGIGSNLTKKFNTRSCVLSLIAEPSYSIGEEPTEDNSLVIVLSGKGNENLVKGYVAGQLGCGCAEYGHISPTRIWNTSVVVDIAATYGRWQAKKLSSYLCK